MAVKMGIFPTRAGKTRSCEQGHDRHESRSGSYPQDSFLWIPIRAGRSLDRRLGST